MANRTDKEAHAIHGTNPQNLMEYIVRKKVYETLYWKEDCFGLSPETLLEKAVVLNHIGGTYGGSKKPTPFICLTLKMLQIQPGKDVIIEMIKNEDFKYVRILGAFYLRLTGRPLEIYQYLEPLLNDFRKIRLRGPDGLYKLSYVDEIIDDLLHKDFLFDTALPRLTYRLTLEQSGQLEPRASALEEDFEEALRAAEEGAREAEEEAARIRDELGGAGRRRSRSPRGRASPSASPARPPPGPPTGDLEDGEMLVPGEGRQKGGRSSRSRSRSRDRRPPDRGRRSRSPRDRDRDRDRDRGGRERGDRRRRSASRSGSRERGGGRGRSRSKSRDRRDRRGGRSRSRSRDRGGRDRGDRGGRDRSRSRDRDRSPPRRQDGPLRPDRDPGRERADRAVAAVAPPRAAPSAPGGGGRSDGRSVAANPADPEIAAANAMRAKLGLKPLK